MDGPEIVPNDEIVDGPEIEPMDETPSASIVEAHLTTPTKSFGKRVIKEHNYFQAVTPPKKALLQRYVAQASQSPKKKFLQRYSEQTFDANNCEIVKEEVVKTDLYNPKQTPSERLRMLEDVYASVREIYNEDQIKKMCNRNSNINYDLKTIQDSIQLYLAVGNSGYEFLRSKKHPYPHATTLRRHMAEISFEPGVLDDFFRFLKLKAEKMSPEEKKCCLSIDEMSLQPKYELDTSTKKRIGGITVPQSSKGLFRKGSKLSKFANENENVPLLANHALSFMLCGTKARWKQLVAYHFTLDSFDANTVQFIIEDIIEKAGEVGLDVTALTMDMGKCNINL